MRYVICVLTHGWVLVGVLENPHEGDQPMTLSRAAVIRRWGTTRGIGELASGPAPETVWDLVPERVSIPRGSLVYSVEATGWQCLERAEPARSASRGR